MTPTQCPSPAPALPQLPLASPTTISLSSRKPSLSPLRPVRVATALGMVLALHQFHLGSGYPCPSLAPKLHGDHWRPGLVGTAEQQSRWQQAKPSIPASPPSLWLFGSSVSSLPPSWVSHRDRAPGVTVAVILPCPLKSTLWNNLVRRGMNHALPGTGLDAR